MKPRIYLYNERWHVYADGHQIIGFILRDSAYAYAKAVWKRGAK